MIIKVLQENRGTNNKGFAMYGYEADSYVFIDDEKAENQRMVIFKDGKEIHCFENPIFKRFFICNNNGKTIDTYEFANVGFPIPKGDADENS